MVFNLSDKIYSTFSFKKKFTLHLQNRKYQIINYVDI